MMQPFDRSDRRTLRRVACRVSLRANGESRLKQFNQLLFLVWPFPLNKIARASLERGKDSRLASGTKESSTRAVAATRAPELT